MQITRIQHTRYMARLTPLLLIMYVIQVMIYRHFAPSHMTSDITLFLGVGLSLIIGAFLFYDHHHKIIFKANHLEVRFDLFKLQKDIFYRDIQNAVISRNHRSFGNITLYLKDGSTCELYHVDNPRFVTEIIRNK